MSLRKDLFAGKKANGLMVKTMRSPVIINLAKQTGIDFIFFDLEHGELSFETVHDLILHANALDMPTVVRIPEATKGYVSRILDLGAKGVICPAVETREQAQALADYARYYPVGRRGYSGGANTDYLPTSQCGGHRVVMENANENIFVVAMVETAKGLENVEEIAAVEGIDMIEIGTNDFSVSLGLYGDKDSPVLFDAIDRILAACLANGKLFGVGGTPAIYDRYREHICMNANATEVDILRSGMKAYVESRKNS